MASSGKREGPVHACCGREHAPPDLESFRRMLQAHMAAKGLRSTGQRRVIVETFFRAPFHVSIEELLAQVRLEEPTIGYATVYRTLKLMTESGVACEREFGDGLTRYELADSRAHHDHLICDGCGSITEFEEPLIERLQEKIAQRYGFTLRSHKHELYGTCPSCQREPPGARPRSRLRR
jgi:Fur family ferric uptake transcriptional regulator